MAGSGTAAKAALLAVGALVLAACSGSSSGGGASTSAAATTPAASASVTASATSATPSATAAAGGLTGCAVATASEVSGAIGATVGPGTEAKIGTLPGLTAHTGCLWHQGTVSAGYDANTYAGGLSPTDRITAGYALVKSKGVAATQVTVDGSTGYEADEGKLQLVTFVKGGALVTVSVGNAKAGGAVALANLLGSRL